MENVKGAKPKTNSNKGNEFGSGQGKIKGNGNISKKRKKLPEIKSTGKTETIKQLAKRLNISYTIEDVTKYT